VIHPFVLFSSLLCVRLWHFGLLHPEEEGITVLRNVRHWTPKYTTQSASKGGGELPGCSPSRHPKTDFEDIMISKVLCDSPFSRNQPQKSADDQCIRILKNKLIKIKKQEARTL
jgi:hypothetical protein